MISPTTEIFTQRYYSLCHHRGTDGPFAYRNMLGASCGDNACDRLFGKLGMMYGGVRLIGFFDTPFVLGIGLSMAQLGEFPFIVLKPGQDLGVISATPFQS